MRPRSRLLIVPAIAVLLASAGCGGSAEEPPSAAEVTTPATSAPTPSEEPEPAEPAPSSEPAAEPVVITIKDFKYAGPESVAPGATVMVTNEDTTAHTVTAEGPGGFDVVIAPGATEEFTAPKQAGEYPYVCTFHANMTGVLVVA